MENKNLLPPGFRDDLSPTTETEHIFMNKIIKIFSSNGYKITKPPLVEYLKSYELKKNIFCITDKDEKGSLKIRNDITTQISRIATSRLRMLERPFDHRY